MREVPEYSVFCLCVRIPENDGIRRDGGLQINNALVAGALEAQSQILLILMEFAVHQNVDVAQQLTRDVPVAQFSGQNIFFIVIAGVAPYRLFRIFFKRWTSTC